MITRCITTDGRNKTWCKIKNRGQDAKTYRNISRASYRRMARVSIKSDCIRDALEPDRMSGISTHQIFAHYFFGNVYLTSREPK